MARWAPPLAGLLAAAVLATGAPAAAATGPTYIPPVDAPVALGFRPPTHHYGSGNRGVDYATAPGDPVWAAAPGVVVFAGRVGASTHVVVLHADGIRTTYGFLARSRVRRGQAVRAGEVVGDAAGPTHFGARAGSAYLDPLQLLRGRPLGVRLVPTDPQPEAQERAAVERMVRAVLRAGVRGSRAAVAWARDQVVAEGRARLEALRAYADHVRSLGAPLPVVLRFIEAAGEWAARACTPASAPQPRLRDRRLVVLVGGFRTSSRSAGVDQVDTAALGYAPADRFRFSYRGGTTDEQPYDPGDTEGDIEVSGARLAALLRRLSQEHPGVPIDVIAHSLGGVVARVAVDELRTSAVPVAHLVTLASPHGGADPASALSLLTATRGGRNAAQRLAAELGLPDPASPAARQLAEGSSFVRRLSRRRWGPGVAVTSIAARHDVVVPSPRCYVPGATNVTVSVDGAYDHGLLPGSAVGTRELALAVSDRPPTCRSLGEVWTDVVDGELIAAGEEAAGLLLGGLGAAAPLLPAP